LAELVESEAGVADTLESQAEWVVLSYGWRWRAMATSTVS